MTGTGIIDQFLETFTRYIDNGFGLLGSDVGYLAATLAAIDITLAALFWSWGPDEDIIARLVKKTLFVGVFASRKVKETDLPLSLALGLLGINGVTAYFGLLDIGQPRPGDTVIVSTAAGAVGSAVGQIAKLMGCRTVGITGGPAKSRLCLEEFGYDAIIDYKSDEVSEALMASCPQGGDVYFDNTAGKISDAVLPMMNVGARIVICGTASVASWDPVPIGPRVERHLLVKRARMSGFLVFDYKHRYEEAIDRIAAWVREGRILYREDIDVGIECCPDAIAKLYRGENLGKQLIRLSR
ncbi:zinc-binding dehydrogenase [Bradyrhizobium sp. ISRA442]|uniref:zinc-binding dehydrogenase n=1 Tax=Bradyrhizobium sp. ISRA442 TaxID=2866197 RepID=UPI00311B34B4